MMCSDIFKLPNNSKFCGFNAENVCVTDTCEMWTTVADRGMCSLRLLSESVYTFTQSGVMPILTPTFDMKDLFKETGETEEERLARYGYCTPERIKKLVEAESKRKKSVRRKINNLITEEPGKKEDTGE